MNPICLIFFYCAPILNPLCSPNLDGNMTKIDFNSIKIVEKTMNDLFDNTKNNENNETIQTPILWYYNLDYSNNTIIFEKWLGRQQMDDVLWSIDNFKPLSINKINNFINSIYRTPIYDRMYVDTNHIWFFVISCAMSVVNYIIIYGFLYVVSNKFRCLRQDIQMYIVSNLSKAVILSYLIFYFLPMVKTILLDNWSDTFWKNITMIYSSTDFVSLFLVTKNKMSTIIHHICVVVSCLLCVTFGDFRTDYLWKSLILYGLFSSLAYGANAFLGLRFLTGRNSITMFIFNYLVAIVYIICCTLNWSIQVYYLIYFIPVSLMSLIYMVCLFFFIKDDLLLIKFQLTYWINKHKMD